MYKKYKNRNEVPTELKWDLSFLLDGESIENKINELLELSKELITIKESKYLSKDAFIDSLKLEDKQIKLFFKVHNYLSNWLSENVVSPEPIKYQQMLSFEMDKINKEIGPELPRIFKYEKQIKEWINLPELKDYKNSFDKIFEAKKHQLPREIQEYRIQSSRGDISVSTPFSILTNAELQFPKAKDAHGKEHIVNHSTFTQLMKSNDKNLRKNASLSYRQGYLNVKETLSNFIFQHFKSETVEAKLKKFDNTIHYLVFSDRSSEKLLLSLYESVKNKVTMLKKARSIHKKIYKAKYGETMTKYDYLMPISDVKVEMSIDEQKELVINALKPMGQEYISIIKKAMNERWIDFATYPGKRTGAYSIGATYGVDKKLILMNDTNDIRSAETLAHELGHSLHSYFSDKNNHLRNSRYQIFVAEIASIFNELMLFDYILKTSNDNKLKLQILHQMITGFDGTVFRQTEWSNYEYDLYNTIENGEPAATYTDISKIYIENAKKYTTENAKKWKPEDGYNSIRVPHFYYGFYVYKYAIGQLCANIFFQRYKENGESSLKDFINNFLSLGGSKNPLEILKYNNIDLEDPKTYETGFKVFEKNINEYEKLAKIVYDKKY